VAAFFSVSPGALQHSQHVGIAPLDDGDVRAERHRQLQGKGGRSIASRRRWIVASIQNQSRSRSRIASYHMQRLLLACSIAVSSSSSSLGSSSLVKEGLRESPIEALGFLAAAGTCALF